MVKFFFYYYFFLILFQHQHTEMKERSTASSFVISRPITFQRLFKNRAEAVYDVIKQQLLSLHAYQQQLLPLKHF